MRTALTAQKEGESAFVIIWEDEFVSAAHKQAKVECDPTWQDEKANLQQKDSKLPMKRRQS